MRLEWPVVGIRSGVGARHRLFSRRRIPVGYLSVLLCVLASNVGSSVSTESDARDFPVVTQSDAPATHSVHVQVLDDLPGPANRSERVAVYRLTDSLYLRVSPETHGKVARRAFAFRFVLSRDAAGDSVLRTVGRPRHGATADLVRAMDFRNADNTGPNELGPKNVNAAGELREIQLEGHVMESRVLSFEIVGLGSEHVPAFSRLSCVVTVTAEESSRESAR